MFATCPIGCHGRGVSGGRVVLLPGPRTAQGGKWHVRERPAGRAGGELRGQQDQGSRSGRRHTSPRRQRGLGTFSGGGRWQRWRQSGVLPTDALGGQMFQKRDRGSIHGVQFEARKVRAPCARRARRRGSAVRRDEAGAASETRLPAPQRKCLAFPLSLVGRREPGRGLRFQKALCDILT